MQWLMCDLMFQIFVRALFDYDPREDDLIPCSQAGVSFKNGDVLKVGGVSVVQWCNCSRSFSLHHLSSRFQKTIWIPYRRLRRQNDTFREFSYVKCIHVLH